MILFIVENYYIFIWKFMQYIKTKKNLSSYIRLIMNCVKNSQNKIVYKSTWQLIIFLNFIPKYTLFTFFSLRLFVRQSTWTTFLSTLHKTMICFKVLNSKENSIKLLVIKDLFFIVLIYFTCTLNRHFFYVIMRGHNVCLCVCVPNPGIIMSSFDYSRIFFLWTGTKKICCRHEPDYL